MNEVKRPKKPLIYYYCIVVAALMLFNLIGMPWLMERQIQEVSYGTFMSMTEEGNIGRVQIEDNQITFTDKEEKQIYKTGIVEDPNRAERLYAAGVTDFGSEIVEETSPLLTILLFWVLPGVIFVAIGQFMSKKMMDTLRYNLSDRILSIHNASPQNTPLDVRWVREHTVIVHYCGKNKPWNPTYSGILDVFYRECTLQPPQ